MDTLGTRKKVSVIGAGRLREWFSQAATRGVGDRWPLTGACPLNNKHEHPNTINKNDEILGHIPLRKSVLVSKFLKPENGMTARMTTKQTLS